MSNDNPVRILKDYDILGVGAARRAALEALTSPCLLQVHPGLVSATGKALYQELLSQTLDWLKPQKVVEEKFLGSAENFVQHLLHDEFLRCFPETVAAMGPAAEIFFKGYLAEFPWQGPLLTDHLRYVPPLVRQQFGDPSLYTLAQEEWLSEYLTYADFGPVKSESGRVTVNPSLQTLSISADDLRVYYYDDRSHCVLMHKMEVLDAAVVDKLQDDRKYTLDQLTEQVLMMEWSQRLASQDIQKRVFFLLERGILQVSDSKIL